MKPEANTELKARFFSQYLGQFCEWPDTDNKIINGRLVASGFEYVHTNYLRKKKGCKGEELSFKANGYHNSDALHCTLKLRPLSQLTDEEAIEVARILDLSYDNSPESEQHFDLAGLSDYLVCIMEGTEQFERHINSGQSILHFYQYLLSRGFLIPFMGYSCEELCSMGWAKIKEK